MKKSHKALAASLLTGAVLAGSSAFAAPFTAGNLVIYRVGTAGGTALSGNAVAVFLDEYSTTGTLVQSVAMPTVTIGSNYRFAASGTATSEGYLTLSADGRYLVATGYDYGINALNVANTSTGRVIARIDSNATINTTTRLTDFANGTATVAGNPRSVVSTNGTDLWVAGNGSAAGSSGVRYTTLGATTSTQLSTTVTNVRNVVIQNGQLYVSTASGSSVRIGTVGTGTPTTNGQTIATLPGLPTNTGSPYGFFFADLSNSVAGLDTLYVADDSSLALTKYSLVAGAWSSNGTIGVDADDYRGLTGAVSGGNVTLFATRKGGSSFSGGGELVSIVDTSGYNGAFSGTPTLLATASTNTAFRGVAFAPTLPQPTISLTQFPSDGNTNLADNTPGNDDDIATAGYISILTPSGTPETDGLTADLNRGSALIGSTGEYFTGNGDYFVMLWLTDTGDKSALVAALETAGDVDGVYDISDNDGGDDDTNALAADWNRLDDIFGAFDVLVRFNDMTAANVRAFNWNFEGTAFATLAVDKVAVIPEPTSLALLGLGAAALLARRRK